MSHTDLTKAVIVDDEPLARKRIRDLLRDREDIEIIAECGNGTRAVEVILEQKPGLVFLDIQMPVMDGFEVIDTIGVDKMPAVIFVTAYDRYAVKAFEVNAVDYLLKPFDQARLFAAVERALKKIRARSVSSGKTKIKNLLRDYRKEKPVSQRILVRSMGKVTIIRVDQIDWIEAAGNYVDLHVGRESHLLRKTMKSLEKKLDRDKFLRIHRSTIVNIERIKELRSHFHGDYVVVLTDGTRLPLGRAYRSKIKSLFDTP